LHGLTDHPRKGAPHSRHHAENDPQVLIITRNLSPRVFIQIGAGAGDQDARAHWRDGFTEFVKSLSLLKQDRIILVEPNPLNISALQKAWAGHSNIEILQLGVVPDDFSDSSL
jgi:hypothetical protein